MTLLRSFVVSLVAVLVAVPLVVLAQDPSSADVGTAIVTLYPRAAPYLGLLPIVQLGAKLLAPLPGRIFGYTHSTVWSRFWDTVAAFPAAPAPRATKAAK
jgi:hypothetical protein